MGLLKITPDIKKKKKITETCGKGTVEITQKFLALSEWVSHPSLGWEQTKAL